jgi:hypothetical protein
LAAVPYLISRRFAEDRQTLFLGRIADLPDARAVRLRDLFKWELTLSGGKWKDYFGEV